LVAHFMPLGVMPTFFNCAQVNAIPYATGGYCTDRMLHDTTPRQQNEGKVPPAVVEESDAEESVEENSGSGDAPNRIRPIDVWRSWVPLSVRQQVPPSFSAWARKSLHR
jgi:hypothetical protein